MKSLTFILITLALLNLSFCQDTSSDWVELTTDEYAADPVAPGAWSVGWNGLLQDAIAQGLFTSDMNWTNTSPTCIFKKNIDGGVRWEFLGNAQNQNGDTCRYLLFVNVSASGPALDYYSYFYQDKFASKYSGGQLFISEANPTNTEAAPAIVTEELAPQEEVPPDFETPEVAVVEENQVVVVGEEEVQVQTGPESESGVGPEVEANSEAEVVVEVETEANANPLAGYIPIDISTLPNYPQGQSALDDGLQLVIQDLENSGNLTPGTWTESEVLKAYLQVANSGINFYFAVTIDSVVNNFTIYGAVEYYVFQDANGVNNLQNYKLGEMWTQQASSQSR